MGKLFIGVEVYALIVSGVHVFTDEAEAKEWYRNYTGVSWNDDPEVREQTVHEDFDQTKIFEVETGL